MSEIAKLQRSEFFIFGRPYLGIYIDNSMIELSKYLRKIYMFHFLCTILYL